MNIQTIIVDILMLLILITALMIVLVGCVGVLRVFIASVFEYDFIKAFKNKKVNPKTKKDNNDLPIIYSKPMGYYKGETDGK